VLSDKVLLFTDSDVFAGTEGHMLDLGLQLRAEGVDVLIGCPVPGALAARAGAAGLDVVPIAKRGKLDWRAVLQVRRVCRDRGVGIIHSHNGRTAFLAAIATVLRGDVRCVETQHFLVPSYVSRKGIKGLLSRIGHRWVDRRTDHLIAISSASRQGSIDRGEATAEKITVIHNGIPHPDLMLLRPVAAVRDELGVAPGEPLLVCAARLQPEKDVATLIDAVGLAAQRLSNLVCVIAGEGQQRDELQERINRNGLQRSVRLLGFRSDVSSIVNAADLFVLPSLAEPFGLVLIEAMSLSKTVVATAAGGPLEIVDDGRTGILVPPGNAVEMAAAITRILGSLEKRQEMGRLGQEKFRAEFTVQRMAQQTLAVYRRVLSEETMNPAVSV
jgi:glycosyltransferase involved in cell wall biosynthesis